MYWWINSPPSERDEFVAELPDELVAAWTEATELLGKAEKLIANYVRSTGNGIPWWLRD
jgi:hypothetical protein